MPAPASRPWQYIHHPCDVAAETLGDFAPLVRLWREHAAARVLPAWNDFEFAAFAGWHDMMVLDAVQCEPFDALTLIWGSRLAEICGYQPRGSRWSESIVMRGLLAEDFAFYRRIVCEPCIGITTGQLDWRERDFVTVSRLYLPCGPSPDAVDRVVSFCVVVSQDR